MQLRMPHAATDSHENDRESTVLFAGVLLRRNEVGDIREPDRGPGKDRQIDSQDDDCEKCMTPMRMFILMLPLPIGAFFCCIGACAYFGAFRAFWGKNSVVSISEQRAAATADFGEAAASVNPVPTCPSNRPSSPMKGISYQDLGITISVEEDIYEPSSLRASAAEDTEDNSFVKRQLAVPRFATRLSSFVRSNSSSSSAETEVFERPPSNNPHALGRKPLSAEDKDSPSLLIELPVPDKAVAEVEREGLSPVGRYALLVFCETASSGSSRAPS